MRERAVVREIGRMARRRGERLWSGSGIAMIDLQGVPVFERVSSVGEAIDMMSPGNGRS